MSRRRFRQIVMIVILVILLALLSAAYVQYRSTKTLGLGIDFDRSELLDVPTYLYSFAGEGGERLARPLGVLVEGGRVYVTDARRSVVDVFTPQGRKLATWGRGKLRVPLYIAKNPRTGNFYVSDRRLRAVFIFGPNGAFKGEFDPKLPKSELPGFNTGGVQWAPLALAFAPDGSLYATEILNGHRLLIFNPAGKFVKAVGTAGIAVDSKEGETAFQFPNSVKVEGKEVWVADSNNRRIQVFNLNGVFKRIVSTQGLPRGFAFLPKLEVDEPRRLVVIDTLSHDGTIWDADKGQKVLTFGSRGVLDAQFSYPNDTSVDAKRRIYIADTSNGRIQVWGWPEIAGPLPVPRTAWEWTLCLSPLLFLPLLLLLRKREYFATQDFVLALYDRGEIDRMPNRRVRWEVLAEDYENLRGLEQNGVSLDSLLNIVDFSQSDARALQDRYELSWRDAVALSAARRAKLFGTEDAELRRMARVLELNSVNHQEFLERTPKGMARGTE